MTGDQLPGSAPIGDPPSQDDLDLFVMGEIAPARGVQEGGVVDIDADADSEAGERTRVVKPYRWWTFALVLSGGLLVAGAAYMQWVGGFVNFGQNTTVAISFPTSAVAYDDGTVVVTMRTAPVLVCDSLPDSCTPNQVRAKWTDSGDLLVGMVREAPNTLEWPVAQPCESAPEGGVLDDGRIVMRSPSGSPPRAVLNYFTGEPVSTGQSASGQESPYGPGFEGIPAPAECVAASDRTSSVPD